jgi:hypothetical protein
MVNVWELPYVIPDSMPPTGEEVMRRPPLTADRMLSELAVRSHLEVSLEHGRLHYALWERDAPPSGVLVTNRRIDY